MDKDMDEHSKLRRFWDSDRSNIALACQLIESYGKSRDFNHLEEFYTLSLSHIAQHDALKLTRAKAYLAAGSFDTAIELFSDCEEDPKFFRTYSLALCYYFKQDFEKTLKLTGPIVGQAGTAQEIIVLHARCLYFLGDIEQAHSTLLTLMSDNVSAEFLGLLAMTAYDLAKIEESQNFAQRALALESNQHDGLIAMASCDIYFQRAQNAQSLAEAALKQFNNSGRAWSVLGQSQLLSQDIDGAYQSLTYATHFMSNHIGTWHLKAWCELIKKNYSEAELSFQSALNLNRNFADSHAGLAIICLHSDRESEADKLIRTALKLDNKCFTAKYAQSLVARKAGDDERAEQLINDVLNHESHIDGTSHLHIIGLLTQEQ